MLKPLKLPFFMLLAIDAGNTDVVWGLYAGGEWMHVWRTPSTASFEPEYFLSRLRARLQAAGLSPRHIQASVLSSVVPRLTPVLLEVNRQLTGRNALLVGPETYKKLSLAIDNPNEIGTDLVANAVAAWHRFGQACVVVDFGTALTFTSLAPPGTILGVAIAPGLKTAMKALFSNTAQLVEVPLELPESVVGKNTVHAIQAGILWGYVGLVKELLQRSCQELGNDCKVVATGGLSAVLHPLHTYFDVVDPRLTLEGLRLIYEQHEQ